VSALTPTNPLFYSLTLGDKKIIFFLVKNNEAVESYFSACGECFPKKVGFYPENGHIRCTACDEWYTVESLKNGIGSCFPVPLKGELKGSRFVITKEALMEGAKFF